VSGPVCAVNGSFASFAARSLRRFARGMEQEHCPLIGMARPLTPISCPLMGFVVKRSESFAIIAL
jgi:hypothetical protein